MLTAKKLAITEMPLPPEPRAEPGVVERAPRTVESYEWEIHIHAPFAFDFFQIVRALFRYPGQPPVASGTGRTKSRRRYYLEVVGYNVGLLLLILLMIPFLMLAFSYVATLPFAVLRAAETAVGAGLMALISALGLMATLTIPIVLFLLMCRPNAYKDYYRKSKVDTFNILIAVSLFFAGGLLEALIASPALRLRTSFTGPVDSTLQWTLFFADRSMNVLFANLPNKIFGPLSDIRVRPGSSEIAMGFLRTLLLFGFVAALRLLALKLCFDKTELFYGTMSELTSYLDYCGKAEARTLRKVVELPDDEVLIVRNRFREPAGSAPGASERSERHEADPAPGPRLEPDAAAQSLAVADGSNAD